jgi:hypothetical protein
VFSDVSTTSESIIEPWPYLPWFSGEAVQTLAFLTSTNSSFVCCDFKTLETFQQRFLHLEISNLLLLEEVELSSASWCCKLARGVKLCGKVRSLVA